MLMRTILLRIVLAMLTPACLAGTILGQANQFVPPPGIKKYAFYPQAGNFFGDLFPNNFVDLDATSGIQDWRCGNYTYDGHLGIDTDIAGFAAQAIGVPIFAALDGTVLEAHDGEFDMNTAFSNQPANYVKLDHGNGQTTTYFHMKKGSVAVTVGQQVKAGQQIGLTGSSGDSTAPHLHFQSEVNGQVFEPFVGPCHDGTSAWVAQPAFRTDLYLRQIVITGDDLSMWKGFPFDTSRTGTFLTGQQRVGLWLLLGNGNSVTSFGVRYVRPDKSVALTGQRFTFPNGAARNSYLDVYYTLNLDQPGTWQIDVLLNDQVFTSAPFTVVSAGPIQNHAPGSVQLAFDPSAPVPSDVLFCRITSPTVYLDPDYDMPRFHYVWKVNGAIIRDVITAALSDAIPHDTGHQNDAVTCTVTPSDGTLSGPAATVSVQFGGAGTASHKLLNISTRMKVLTGENVLIGGFIVTGNDQKKLLVRGLGPSLPVAGQLADPTLELHQGNTTLARNDNWRATQEQEIKDTTVPPKNDFESAMVRTLAPGNYTAVLSGNNSGIGVGQVEVYDLTSTANSQLANISTRGFVDTGDNVMIGGVIIGGGASGATAKVLVRAIGPSLTGQSVNGALQDPMLELRGGNGQLVAQNDNWRTDQEQAIKDTTVPPTDDRESAIVQVVGAGNYTAIVRGKANSTGVGLVEVYNLQ
jgi:hypothetical protein